MTDLKTLSSYDLKNLLFKAVISKNIKLEEQVKKAIINKIGE